MPGQHQVQHDEVGAPSRIGAQRRLAVAGLDDLVAGRSQVGGHHLAHGGVVVDHEHRAMGHSSSAVGRGERSSPSATAIPAHTHRAAKTSRPG